MRAAVAHHIAAHSSSGLGRRPLKAEIAGSNPAWATTPNSPVVQAGEFFFAAMAS